MAETSKPIGYRGRKTRMCRALLLFVDTHPVRKMLEVGTGLEYIHSEGVVHGDLRGVFYLDHNTLRY